MESDALTSEIFQRFEALGSRKLLTLKDDVDTENINPLAIQDSEASKRQCRDYVRFTEDLVMFSKSLNENSDTWVSLQEATEALQRVTEELKQLNSQVDEEKENVEQLCEDSAEVYETLQKNQETIAEKLHRLIEKSEHVAGLKQQHQAVFNSVGDDINSAREFHELKQKQNERLTTVKSALESNQTSAEYMKQDIERMKQKVQQLQKERERQLEVQKQKNSQHEVMLSEQRERTEKMRDLLEVYRSDSCLRTSVNNGRQLNVELCNNASGSDVPNLCLNVAVKTDKLDIPRLESAKVSEWNLHTDDVISQGLAHDDLPQLVTTLQNSKTQYFPLMSEMKMVSDKHAVDWIQDQGIIRVLVGKGGNMVCSLHMPETYPHSGAITLVETSGLPENVKQEDICPPADRRGLQGWVEYLEDMLGKP